VVKQPVKAVTTTRKHTASRPTLSDDAVQLLVREELQKAMQSMKIELRQELSAADQTKLLEKEVCDCLGLKFFPLRQPINFCESKTGFPSGSLGHQCGTRRKTARYRSRR
jgi:hypothetical protein